MELPRKKELQPHLEKVDFLIKNNKDFFNIAEKRIKFIKFFKYVLAMKRFDAIISKFISFFLIIRGAELFKL